MWPDLTIADYAERSATQRAWWTADGTQPGDPDKLAHALLKIVDAEPPPKRYIAGPDVVALAQRKVDELEQQIASPLNLSIPLTFDPSEPAH